MVILIVMLWLTYLQRLLNIGTAFDELEAKFQDFRAAQDKERVSIVL